MSNSTKTGKRKIPAPTFLYSAAESTLQAETSKTANKTELRTLGKFNFMRILSGDALNRSMTSFLGPEASETESGLGVEQPQQSRISCDGSE